MITAIIKGLQKEPQSEDNQILANHLQWVTTCIANCAPIYGTIPEEDILGQFFVEWQQHKHKLRKTGKVSTKKFLKYLLYKAIKGCKKTMASPLTIPVNVPALGSKARGTLEAYQFISLQVTDGNLNIDIGDGTEEDRVDTDIDNRMFNRKILADISSSLTVLQAEEIEQLYGLEPGTLNPQDETITMSDILSQTKTIRLNAMRKMRNKAKKYNRCDVEHFMI
ncbi:MAG: hypothetical protein NC218_08135 [Acetobacter sp.]|nr:hypothetical protein [Acetobacter sp.]